VDLSVTTSTTVIRFLHCTRRRHYPESDIYPQAASYPTEA
jgi:hypothetical protein